MYHKNYLDFKKLELCNETELVNIIETTQREYDELQAYMKSVEDTLQEQWEIGAITYFEYLSLLPKVDAYINNLHNLEGYIRKASDLLEKVRKQPKKELPTLDWSAPQRVISKLKFNL